MFDKLKANILFSQLLKRKDINKAYAMVGPEDSWYDTISKVHTSLAEIKQLPSENLEIISHDGLKLKAVFYPGTGNKTVIWVHGYTSHAERESAFPGLFYLSLGYNVLIPYLRAHGPSEGTYLSFGALEYRDIMQWVNAVNDRYPKGKIILHGLSMGGAVVLDLSDKPMDNVACLIADAPNVSIQEVFRSVSQSVFKKHFAPVFDCALERFRKEFGVDARDFEALEIVKNSRYPIFLTAGSNENLEDTLNALKDTNPMDTEVLILPGCNHGNGMYKQTELYQSAIKAFLDKHTACKCKENL